MIGNGFGYTRSDTGELIKKPSSFGVSIGNNVDIGINTVIDSGSYRDTVIGEGTKIDNLCHIAHNVIIGKHCLIVAGTVLGGSVEIGDYSYLGLNSSVKDHVKIGSHCIIGAGSTVIYDIPDNSVVAGNPAKHIRNNLTDKQKFEMAYVR